MSRLTRTIYFVLALGALAVAAPDASSAARSDLLLADPLLVYTPNGTPVLDALEGESITPTGSLTGSGKSNRNSN